MTVSEKLGSNEIIERAAERGVTIPAFNIPYLPMLKPVVAALREENAFGFIAVARLEWIKFESKSMDAVKQEFDRHQDPAHVRLHLDHIPVIDEDGIHVDYRAEIGHALALGFSSVMVDGSRLPLPENIAATAEIAQMAHDAGVPVEAELGAVLGHEEGPLPPYEELFESKRGFTDVEEARSFAARAGCDWLSVSFGNIHGAVSKALRDQEKPRARLDIDHLKRLREATQLPLVLHGGSGIETEYLHRAIENGVAKVNVGTDIRQAYEREMAASNDTDRAQDAVFAKTRTLLGGWLGVSGSCSRLFDE
jgi:ketose-bisphosphate aldolase